MPKEADGSLGAAKSFAQGYEALRERAALVDSRGAEWLTLRGADRLRFANGLVSCDLKTLSPGEGSYGFFTDPKGKVIADAAFLASESALWIELPRGKGEPIEEHMSKYLVADQVEIEARDYQTIWVAGPEAAGPLREVLGEIPATGAWGGVVLEVEKGRLVVRAERRLGVPAWSLAGSADRLANLTERLGEAGLETADAAAVSALRIEGGVPWFGLDFSLESADGSFPQETGLEEWAVSFEKGCYLGQEVIARIHFRGKVNRSLRGLVFEPDAAPRAGIELSWQGEVVGVMNSVAISPLMGRPVGLAIVHHKAEPGSTLDTGYGPCRLIELPFPA